MNDNPVNGMLQYRRLCLMKAVLADRGFNNSILFFVRFLYMQAVQYQFHLYTLLFSIANSRTRIKLSCDKQTNPLEFPHIGVLAYQIVLVKLIPLVTKMVIYSLISL